LQTRVAYCCDLLSSDTKRSARCHPSLGRDMVPPALDTRKSMKRRQLLAALGGLTCWPLMARAQRPALPVVGVLGAASGEEQAPYIEAFVRGLSQAGFVEGHNVTIEYRWADGRYDRLPSLATELVRRQVAVIVASGGQVSLRAAAAATSAIPIVFAVAVDPVAEGYVNSLNRPGGNVTGVSFLAQEVAAKRFELLRELVPTVSKMALLVNPAGPSSDAERREVEAAARDVGQSLIVLKAITPDDIEAAFTTSAGSGADAILVSSDPLFLRQRRQIVELAAHHTIPAGYFEREFVVAGGLMSYSTSLREAYHQEGIYVGRILAGEKPSDLPIVRPTKIEFVLNLKTARTLRLTVPDKLLALADDVIE
jgi:putative tryptophan/tyrosine transport system substrate-binding protein